MLSFWNIIIGVACYYYSLITLCHKMMDFIMEFDGYEISGIFGSKTWEKCVVFFSDFCFTRLFLSFPYLFFHYYAIIVLPQKMFYLCILLLTYSQYCATVFSNDIISRTYMQVNKRLQQFLVSYWVSNPDSDFLYVYNIYFDLNTCIGRYAQN